MKTRAGPGHGSFFNHRHPECGFGRTKGEPDSSEWITTIYNAADNMVHELRDFRLTPQSVNSAVSTHWET
jgi:hypothetical protein